MNKVIAALDALRLSESTVDYAVYLAKEFDAHIVAAFLEEMVYHARPAGEDDRYLLTDWSQMDTVIQKEEELRIGAKNKVKTIFEAAGVHFNIHRDKVFALNSLIEESRYAD